MSLPPEIQKAIDAALRAVDEDIIARHSIGRGDSDLRRMRQELEEMRAGTRIQCSPNMSYIIIDSMDWGQPCLKQFNIVRELLQKHYRIKR